MTLAEIVLPEEKSRIASLVLHALPEWFGLPDSTAEYIQNVARYPFWAAYQEEEPVGFISVLQHFPKAAELYVMGILPAFHRQGTGRTLVQQAEEWCAAQGVEFLQVKTLDASSKDKFYARTLQFYISMGFTPMECLPTLWGEQNPCLILVKHIPLANKG